MIVFVVGGSKSGKSSLGEKYAYNLKDQGELYYLATMNPYDLEDEERINIHKESRRKYNFTTIEKYKDIGETRTKYNFQDTVFLDSITSLVTNEIFMDELNLDVVEKITKDIYSISKSVENLVIVSDYLFSDGIVYDNITDGYRKVLGSINCYIASISDIVVESSFGNIIIHKGEEWIKDEKFI